MQSLTLIIQQPPYGQDKQAWDALRFAGAALTEDMQVRVHLLDAAVTLVRRGHEVPEGATDLGQLLGELMECGLEVAACGKALDGHGIDQAALMPDVERGSMKSLAHWVRNSDGVLSF